MKKVIINDLYEFFEDGAMINLKTKKPLKPKMNHGHLCYDIINRKIDTYDKRKYVRVYVHNILCQYFKKKEWFPFCEVHHINGNKTDNRLDNLQCLTPKQHKAIHSEMKNVKPVKCVETGVTYRSCYQAYKILTGETDRLKLRNHHNIKTAIERNGTCLGYHWIYGNKEDVNWELKNQIEFNPVRCIETGATFPHLQAFTLYVSTTMNEHLPKESLETHEYLGLHFEYILEKELGKYDFVYHRKPNAKKKRINYFFV